MNLSRPPSFRDSKTSQTVSCKGKDKLAGMKALNQGSQITNNGRNTKRKRNRRTRRRKGKEVDGTQVDSELCNGQNSMDLLQSASLDGLEPGNASNSESEPVPDGPANSYADSNAQITFKNIYNNDRKRKSTQEHSKELRNRNKRPRIEKAPDSPVLHTDEVFRSLMSWQLADLEERFSDCRAVLDLIQCWSEKLRLPVDGSVFHANFLPLSLRSRLHMDEHCVFTSFHASLLSSIYESRVEIHADVYPRVFDNI